MALVDGGKWQTFGGVWSSSVASVGLSGGHESRRSLCLPSVGCCGSVVDVRLYLVGEAEGS